MRRARHAVVLAALLAALGPLHAAAQTPDPAPVRSDPDVVLDPLQPDFTLAALPTTLRMPAGRWAFRVTHRFTRNLASGSFGDHASSLFGLDGGAQIGLEVRIGVAAGTQLGIHRTSDRAIQLFVQQNLLSERRDAPFGADVLVTLEGDDNLSEHHQTAIGAVLSKYLGRRAAVYAEPLVVVNANPLAAGDAHTLMLGLGARVRAGASRYLFAEVVPRLAGHRPAAHQFTVGFESRAGGHLFQLNAGNGWGTTLGQLARGGIPDQWFLGFNISRKFF
ncbi:MAG TPA: DUF5777 family beta-barrel protein [Vicinamibacterales bacterium]|nr:DUF5777 family beta-barrel protein [Vicinamibacterales bacterium]